MSLAANSLQASFGTIVSSIESLYSTYVAYALCRDFALNCEEKYIGELCRYLLNRPVHPLERKHRVRLIYGNGMQADVWRKMRDRFEIPDILEFYGATEGIGGFHNYNRGEYGLGSVGIYGPISRATYFRGARIIKIDPITEEPQRNKAGFCEEVRGFESSFGIA